jgi:hypothetical protein
MSSYIGMKNRYAPQPASEVVLTLDESGKVGGGRSVIIDSRMPSRKVEEFRFLFLLHPL